MECHGITEKIKTTEFLHHQLLTKLVVGQTTTSQILPSTQMHVAMLVILAIQGMVLVMECSPVALAFQLALMAELLATFLILMLAVVWFVVLV